MTTLLQNTAIVGIGQTEFSKFSGRSELQLAVEASRAAHREGRAADANYARLRAVLTFREICVQELLLEDRERLQMREDIARLRAALDELAKPSEKREGSNAHS